MTSDQPWVPRRMPAVRRAIAAQADEIAATYESGALDQVAAATGHSPGAMADHMRGTAARSRVAELFWVTEDMTRLALSSTDDLPEWTPAAVVPAPAGLLVWDGGLPNVPWWGAPERSWSRDPFGVHQPPAITMDAVLWATHGGVISVDLLTRTDRIADSLQPRWLGAPLFNVWVLDPPLAAGEPITDTGDPGGLGDGVRALLGATWLMMSQPTLAESSQWTETGRRARSARRAGRDPDGVRIIDLRRATHESGTEPGPGREYRSRWIVRGHWRQQAVGPGRSQRRPTWVQPHVKGPDDAPLAVAEYVHVWRR